MYIFNCFESYTCENPNGFSFTCIFAKFIHNLRNCNLYANVGHN